MPVFLLTQHQSSKSRLGFTLIELLVIIAVIGVLAAAIIVLIDPFEKLAQARDASRIADVRNLYQAIENWNVATQLVEGNTSYNLSPSAGDHWQQALVDAGIQKGIRSAPINFRGTCTYNSSSTNDHGYCMSNNGATPGEIEVWTLVESRAQTIKAGGACATSPSTNYAVVVSSSNRNGKTGVTCIGTDTATAPAWGAVLN